MAYTYDDFTSAATKAGLLDKFSPEDMEIAKRSPEYGLSILSLMQDSANATTGEQKLLASEATNQLRKTYGYGAKVDETLGKIENYGSFSYDNADDYNKLLQAVTNPDAFSYDPETDPVFSSYAKTYKREGERAAADTLAKAAAATGGIPSSYAVGAAQQAANYYSAGLADIIPQLYSNAYSRYLNDFGMKQSGLSALESDRTFKYNNWLTGYDMLQNLLGNYQTQDATGFNRYLTMLEQNNTNKQQAYNNALALYQTLGYATPEIAAVLGIPEGTKLGGTVSGGTGGRVYDGNPKSGANNGTLTDAQVAEMQGWINALGGYSLDTDGRYGPKSQAATTELLGGSYGAEDAYKMLSDKIVGLKAEGVAVKTYDDAVSYMKKIGMTDAIGGLLDANTWSNYKYRFGDKLDETNGYNTYAEYLSDYMLYVMDTYFGALGA